MNHIDRAAAIDLFGRKHPGTEPVDTFASAITGLLVDIDDISDPELVHSVITKLVGDTTAHDIARRLPEAAASAAALEHAEVARLLCTSPLLRDLFAELLPTSAAAADVHARTTSPVVEELLHSKLLRVEISPAWDPFEQRLRRIAASVIAEY